MFNQFFRFIAVGLLNTALNYSVYLFLIIKARISYTSAGAIGFMSGAVIGYLMNRTWTFKSNISLAYSGINYFCVQLFCLAVHMIVQNWAVVFLSIPQIYSQFVGIVITTFLNFTLSKVFVFREKCMEG